jgi:hypothetical protein
MHADEMQMQWGASEEYSRQRSSLRTSEERMGVDAGSYPNLWEIGSKGLVAAHNKFNHVPC